MAGKIAILTDTNSGISSDDAQKHGIYLIPMPVIIDGKTYFENTSITSSEFFERLRDGATVSTSQPSPGDLVDTWDRLLQEHDEIVYIPMSSGLSGSWQTSAAVAEEYGGRIHTVNNRRISVTLRKSVLDAKRLADCGWSAAEIAQALEQDGLNASIYIAVNTLELLIRSGRVTPAGATIGTVLQIKPVLQIQGGKLDACRKVRGMKAAMRAIVEALEADRNGRFAGQPVMIRGAYAGDAELGEMWTGVLRESFPDLAIESDPLSISVSCHTGEGALGVGIMPAAFKGISI